MSQARPQPSDPIAWCWAISLGSMALLWVGAAAQDSLSPETIHHVQPGQFLVAARDDASLPETFLIDRLAALGMDLFGDNAIGRRLMPIPAGVLTVFAAMRAAWFASQRRAATVLVGIIAGAGLYALASSPVAAPDILHLAFFTAVAWQCAGAMREPETGRRRLAIAGLFSGLAMASKWALAALAFVPLIAFAVLRWRAGRRRFLLSRRGAPVPGVTLIEAAFWLGVLPVLVNAAILLSAQLI